MVRALGMTGLAVTFLVISPKFRGNIWNTIGAGVGVLDQFSPISYLLLAAALVFGFLVFLRSASGPRVG